MVAIIPIFMGKVSLNVEHLCTKFVKARNTCIMPNSEWYEVLHWHSITFFLFRLESVDTLRYVSLCREQTWWRTEVCQYISNHWWSVVSNGIASVTELSPDFCYITVFTRLLTYCHTGIGKLDKNSTVHCISYLHRKDVYTIHWFFLP